MNKIPFSLYDFFGYLAAGCAWLFVALDLFNLLPNEVLDRLSLALGVLVVIPVYIAGHINAHFASWLIEKRIIGALGYPSVNFFKMATKPHRIFKGFRKDLPMPLKELILSRYEKATGSREPGQAMFLYCFHTVKEKCQETAARLQSFMGLYGFCRNMSFALLAIGLLQVVKWALYKEERVLFFGIGIVITSIVLFLRALKFFRHYSEEVFATYGTMREN